VIGMAFSAVLYNRKLYLEDQARNKVNQNLRAAIDLVGTDIKQAGERLTDPKIPVIQVTRNANGTSELILLRNLIGTVLPVCGTINAGSNTDVVFVADRSANPPAGCTPVPDANNDGWPDNLEVWRNYRCAQDKVTGCQGNASEVVRAYIYDGNGKGEFFTYDADDNSNFKIHKSNSTFWQNNYSTNSSIYLIEERHYTLQNNTLKLITNGTVTQNLVNELASFQANVLMSSNQLKDTFPGAGESWQQLQSLQVTLTVKDTSKGLIKAKNLQISGHFFPRNVLSR
jgi:type IV pilus assembly protein PilW